MSAEAPFDLPAHFLDPAPLGEGAFGKVYRARTATGAEVAIKVLAPEMAGRPEVVWQFTGEYRRLARLDHEAFPAAVEEGVTPGGSPYYAMAFVPGRPLDQALPVDAAEARRLLGQLAGALEYLHGLGLIHGDLKPENALKGPEGQLHLIDVGLMAPVGQKREGVTGTLEYMAPEAFRKAPAAPAEDLYALGALAFELLTGSPPFRGGPAELIKQHLQAPAPVPTGYAGGPDAALEALIAALLEKAPEARPASAHAVRVALGLAAPGEADEAATLRGGAFIGREEVLAAWREALAGGDRRLAITGPAGSGKSRTLDELRLLAQLAGLSWAGASCTAALGAPAAPIRQLVRQALSAAQRSPGPVLEAWLAGGVSEAVAELDPAAAKAMIYAAAAEALDAAAGASGLAIGLDDADRADEATLEFLAFAARRPSPGHVCWALALDRVSEGFKAAPERQWALQPLTDAEAMALVASRLGGPASEGLSALLLPAAAGNPQMLELVLEHLVTTKRLRPRQGAWCLEQAPAGAGRLPGSLQAIWRSKLEALDPEARALVTAAAIAAPAGGASAPALAELAGLGPAALQAAADGLLASGLLAAEDGRLQLALPGLAETASDQLDTGRRAALSTRLARSLLSGHAVDRAPFEALIRAARLALAGDDDAWAFALATEAGRRSLALAAPAEARRLLEAAESRMPEGLSAAEKLALFLPRAEARRFLDAAQDAVGDYEKAIASAAEAGDAGSRARAWNGLAKCRQLLGDYESAIAALAEADAAGEQAGDRAQRVRTAVAEGRVRLFRGDPAGAMACGERAIALAREAGAPALLAQALNMRGVLLLQASDPSAIPEAIEALGEALALSRALGDRLGEVFSLDNLGNAHLSVGDLAGAAEAFAGAGAVCQAIGAETEALSAHLNLAIVAGERGDLALADRLAIEVARKATAVGRKFPVGVVEAVRGQVAWRQARPAEALPHFDEALEAAFAIKNTLLEEHIRTYRLEAILALGDREAARAEMAILAPMVEQHGSGDMLARLACHRAELQRLDGLAVTGLQAIAEGAHQIASHRAHQILARAALAAQDAERARSHAEAALAIADAWGAPYHQAEDAWLAAEAAALAGEADRAAALCRRALAPADDPHWPARAGAALRLSALGEAREAAPMLESATAALGGVLALPETARTDFWAAWGLAGFAERMAGAPRLQTLGLAIDPADFAWRVESVAMAEGEAAIGAAALAGAMAMVRAERGYLLIYEEGRLAHAITQDMDYAHEVEGGFSTSIANEALFSSQPLYVQDASGDAEWSASKSVMALGLKTVVALPLATPDTTLGVLYMDREAIEPLLTDGDMALLGAFATTAALAMTGDRARQALGGEAERQRRLASLGAAMAARAPGGHKLEAVLDAALAAANAERVFWLRRDAASGEWGAIASRDTRGQAPEANELSRGLADWVEAHSESLSILDTSSDGDWQARRSVQALGARTVWCAVMPGRGVLYLDARDYIPPDPAPALRMLEAIASFASPLLA